MNTTDQFNAVNNSPTIPYNGMWVAFGLEPPSPRWATDLLGRQKVTMWAKRKDRFAKCPFIAVSQYNLSGNPEIRSSRRKEKPMGAPEERTSKFERMGKKKWQ